MNERLPLRFYLTPDVWTFAIQSNPAEDSAGPLPTTRQQSRFAASSAYILRFLRFETCFCLIAILMSLCNKACRSTDQIPGSSCASLNWLDYAYHPKSDEYIYQDTVSKMDGTRR